AATRLRASARLARWRHNRAPAFLEKEGHRAVNAPAPRAPRRPPTAPLSAPLFADFVPPARGERALTVMAPAQQERHPAGVGGVTPAFHSNCSKFYFSCICVELSQ